MTARSKANPATGAGTLVILRTREVPLKCYLTQVGKASEPNQGSRCACHFGRRSPPTIVGSIEAG